jgi:hypothetical protein
VRSGATIAKEQIMSNKMLSSLTLALTLAAGTAFAAAPEKDPGQQEPTKSAQPSQSMQAATPTTSETAMSSDTYAKFDALDVDHDGSIDQQEAKASKTLTAEFKKLDTNKDGKLSMAEFSNAKDLASIKVDQNDKGH